jgi:hypothetical protein
VNYGFTVKRKFGNAFMIQELNFQNCATIEDAGGKRRSLDQLRRRVLCARMGLASLTMNPSEVDEDT